MLKLVPPEDAPHGVADPQLLFDYRCYLPGGKEAMGIDFSPRISQCLRNIAGMTVAQVQKHYDLVDELPAFNLQARATGEALVKESRVSFGSEWKGP